MSLLWTKSALDRLHQNNLTQAEVEEAFRNADASFPGKIPGSTMYQRKLQTKTINVIAKQTDRGWLVMSVFAKGGPKMYGKPNIDPRYKGASFWKRILLDLMSTFGM